MPDLPTELLQAHLLPRLGLRDLVALRQACAALRGLVTEAPASSLRQAAQNLPASHPVHSAASVGAFLAAQSRVARALAAGSDTWSIYLLDELCSKHGIKIACSPDATKAAARKGAQLLVWELPGMRQIAAVDTPEPAHSHAGDCSSCFWTSCSMLVGWAEDVSRDQWSVCTYHTGSQQLARADMSGERLSKDLPPAFVLPGPAVVVAKRIGWETWLHVVQPSPAGSPDRSDVCPVQPDLSQGTSCCAASARGVLAFAVLDLGQICLWRPGVSHLLVKCRRRVSALDWSPDGAAVVLMGDSHLLVVSEAGARLASFSQHQYRLVAWPAWGLSGVMLMGLSQHERPPCLQVVKVVRGNDTATVELQTRLVFTRSPIKLELGPVLSPDLCLAAVAVCINSTPAFMVFKVSDSRPLGSALVVRGLGYAFQRLDFVPRSLVWVSDGTGVCLYAKNRAVLVKFLP